MMNKRKTIILYGTIAVITIIIAALLVYSNRTDTYDSTGGSGAVPAGTVTLRGYELKPDASKKLSLGGYFASYQQLAISSYLGAVLFEKEPLTEYFGAINPGSITINYSTNIISFNATIEKPAATYTINYNLVTDEMTLYDEAGNSIRPTLNPDGTPFAPKTKANRLN